MHNKNPGCPFSLFWSYMGINFIRWEEQQTNDGNTNKSDELSDEWSSDCNSSEESDESEV